MLLLLFKHCVNTLTFICTHIDYDSDASSGDFEDPEEDQEEYDEVEAEYEEAEEADEAEEDYGDD